MEWEQLLCTERLRERSRQGVVDGKYPISEFERDYGRIITSASFRRLQDKTQVFPLDKSDFVRTRLTHSIEVASLAKRLGEMVIKNIKIYHQSNNPNPIPEGKESEILDLLMCSGLLHDLGNPPFGHFGEVVIGEWFQDAFASEKLSYKGKNVTELLEPQMLSDLMHFEGNAQTLRILTKLHPAEGRGAMNLTPALLNVLVKYPCTSLKYDEMDSDVKNHKPGYYLAEKQVFDRISNHTGTAGTSGRDSVRHPLTYLLEAADDIAYATADLEDAHKKGMFSIYEFQTLYMEWLEAYKDEMTEEQYDKSRKLIEELVRLQETLRSDQTAFQEWVEYARDWLLYSAAYGFTLRENYDAIMEGTYQNEIIKGTFHEYSMQIIKKNVMHKYVYTSPDIEKLELSAETILTSLMDRFVPAVIYMDEPAEQSKGNQKLVNLISDNYINAYQQQRREGQHGYNLYLRLLLATDYISGMTDSFAKDLYQSLNGIY